MAYLVEVTKPGYYSVHQGVFRALPVGTQIVVAAKPASWGAKLKLIREVDDGELIVNDTPIAAKLRAEGKVKEADEANATEGKGSKAEPVKRNRGRPSKGEGVTA